MGWITDLAKDWALGLFGWGLVIGTLTALEIAAPIERQSMKGRLRSLGFWAVFILATLLTYRLSSWLFAGMGVKPLVTIPIGAAVSWTGWGAIILAPLGGAAFADFLGYWFHRAQHRFFWRWHAVHHSVRELNAASSYHHVSETAFRIVLLAVPTALISADAGPVLPVIAIALQFQQTYLHSPTWANFGAFRRVIADNRYHRIHHSLNTDHFDKNFAVITPIWDVLFGTAYWPKPGEWPKVGIPELDEPRTLREYLDLPLRFPTAAAEAQLEPAE